MSTLGPKPLISPENVPLWVVAGFVVALLALVLSFINVYRTNVVILGTRTEAFALNKKIEDLRKQQGVPAPVAQAAPTLVEPAKP